MPYSEIDIIMHPERYLHNIQVDNVIFGYHDKELKVLLQADLIAATSKHGRSRAGMLEGKNQSRKRLEG